MATDVFPEVPFILPISLVAVHSTNISGYNLIKICNILSALRFREIVALRTGLARRTPASYTSHSMYIPTPANSKASDTLVYYRSVMNWRKTLGDFMETVSQWTAESINVPVRQHDHPLLSLINMMETTDRTANYLAIAENILFVSFEIAAMKDISFKRGELPYLPATCLNLPSISSNHEEFAKSYNSLMTKDANNPPNRPTKATLGFRNGFQLATLISPIYLLTPVRLSQKPYVRRTIIDHSSCLGPHRPTIIIQIENAIWDSIFLLAGGTTPVNAVLRSLSSTLTSLLENYQDLSDTDTKCFNLPDRVPYTPSTSVSMFKIPNRNQNNPVPDFACSPSQACAPSTPLSTTQGLPLSPPMTGTHLSISRILSSEPSTSLDEFSHSNNAATSPQPDIPLFLKSPSTNPATEKQMFPSPPPLSPAPPDQSNHYFTLKSNPLISVSSYSSNFSNLNPSNVLHNNRSPGFLLCGIGNDNPDPLDDNPASISFCPSLQLDLGNPFSQMNYEMTTTSTLNPPLDPHVDDPEASDKGLDRELAIDKPKDIAMLDPQRGVHGMNLPETQEHGNEPRCELGDNDFPSVQSNDNDQELDEDPPGDDAGSIPITPTPKDTFDSKNNGEKDTDSDEDAPGDIGDSIPATPTSNKAPLSDGDESDDENLSVRHRAEYRTVNGIPTEDLNPLEEDDSIKSFSDEQVPEATFLPSTGDGLPDNESDLSDLSDSHSGENEPSIGMRPSSSANLMSMPCPGSSQKGEGDHQGVGMLPAIKTLDTRDTTLKIMLPALCKPPIRKGLKPPKTPTIVPSDADSWSDELADENASDVNTKQQSQTFLKRKRSSTSPPQSLPSTREASPLSPAAMTWRSGKFGTAENSFNVDTIDDMYSVFEPSIVQEFKPTEEISLDNAIVPDQILGKQRETIFTASGHPIAFLPSFHWPLYHERFQQILGRIRTSYIGNLPMHIARPELSVIGTYKYAAWMELTPLERQEAMARRNIIVTGCPIEERIEFDEAGLRKVAGSNGQQISIQDYSIEPTHGFCSGVTLSGRVGDLWANRGYNGKILNALDFPMHDGNTVAQEHTSDLHAWGLTHGHHNVHQGSAYPTEHMRWSLVGLRNALTFCHIDCDGVSTVLNMLCGGKYWIFVCPRQGNPLSSPNFFLDKGFHLDRVPESSDYELEAAALQQGDRLYMKPNQPHFVYTYADSMCRGGHYYFTHHMQETLSGLAHAFVLHKFLTNTSHPIRQLIRRMVLFYHLGLLKQEFNSKDPAHSHLPNITEMSGIMNLISACVLVVLGNILDFRTYHAPNQEEGSTKQYHETLIECDINTIPLNERLAMCHTRGVAMHLMEWIHTCAVITGPRDEIIHDLPSYYCMQP